MTHVCTKYGAIFKYSEDKQKGAWITTGAAERAEKCACATQDQSIAPEKHMQKKMKID